MQRKTYGRKLADPDRKFERNSERCRKRDLIEATLAVIANQGIDAATVRAIAVEANVTPGLIRYYFSSKEELVAAAYEHHMTTMTNASGNSIADIEDICPKVRLAKFITVAISPPITNLQFVTLWAGFLSRARSDHNMLAIHQNAYFDFRDRVEHLIVEIMEREGKPLTPGEAMKLATALTAIIDGLWLEGGLLPKAFAPEEIVDIVLNSCEAILGVELVKA